MGELFREWRLDQCFHRRDIDSALSASPISMIEGVLVGVFMRLDELREGRRPWQNKAELH